MSTYIDYVYEIYDEIAKASELDVDATIISGNPVEVRLFKSTTTNVGVFLVFSETNRNSNPPSINAADAIRRAVKKHAFTKFTTIVVTKEDYGTANKMAEYIIDQLEFDFGEENERNEMQTQDQRQTC